MEVFQEILKMASVSIALVIALTEFSKQFVSESNSRDKILSIVNLIEGIIITVAFQVTVEYLNTDIVTLNTILLSLWAGLIAGLVAGKFFDLGKYLISKPAEKEE